MRYVTLGNGKQVTLGQYVQAIKIAKANPQTYFADSLTGWHGSTGAETVEAFLVGVHDRINRHIHMLDDRKGASKRLLRRLRLVGRECKGCSHRVVVATINDHFCSAFCREEYYQ